MGTRVPKALRRLGKEDFGLLTWERAGLPPGCQPGAHPGGCPGPSAPLGGMGVGLALLGVLGVLELNRAVEYALLLEYSTRASKVGVFPDQHRESLMVDQLHL